MKKILLVNPWIYDFAAYDLWIKPWGLLKISSILKKNGFQVHFVDALNSRNRLPGSHEKILPDGTGKFHSEEIEKPDIFKDIPKKYKRYGITIEQFKSALPRESIDLVLVSSGMTYWYGGVFEAIRILRETYDKAEIVLGGVYATLAYNHAVEKSGADHIITNKELDKLSVILGRKCDFSFKNVLDERIDYGWYDNAAYGVLRLSLGCPFDCTYCAQKELAPDFILKDSKKAMEELKILYGAGIKNFAFYDDALFFDTGYISEYLQKVAACGISANFYTPNGLHARFVTPDIAHFMRETNFVNPTLSLEISNDTKGVLWHSKVNRKDLEQAVEFLKNAGYGAGSFMVYLMIGAPGSDMRDVREGIDYIHSLGGKISLSEFSPVPGTVMARDFKGLLDEPLLHNNSAFPSFSLSEWEEVRDVKAYARRCNEVLAG